MRARLGSKRGQLPDPISDLDRAHESAPLSSVSMAWIKGARRLVAWIKGTRPFSWAAEIKGRVPFISRPLYFPFISFISSPDFSDVRIPAENEEGDASVAPTKARESDG
jgi:hypothetical protein